LFVSVKHVLSHRQTPGHVVVEGVVDAIVVEAAVVVGLGLHSQQEFGGLTNSQPVGQVVILQTLPHFVSPSTHLQT